MNIRYRPELLTANWQIQPFKVDQDSCSRCFSIELVDFLSLVLTFDAISFAFSLMLACFGGHQDVVRLLREAGADWLATDRGGSSAIHYAVDSKNCELIKWMINDGAPVSFSKDFYVFYTTSFMGLGINDTATLLE